MTEIKLTEEESVTSGETGPFEPEETEEPEEVETEGEEMAPVKERIEVPEAPSECLHHLGYLSEKSSKEQIPDECMMCKDIVTCMLKKMKE